VFATRGQKTVSQTEGGCVARSHQPPISERTKGQRHPHRPNQALSSISRIWLLKTLQDGATKHTNARVLCADARDTRLQIRTIARRTTLHGDQHPTPAPPLTSSHIALAATPNTQPQPRAQLVVARILHTRTIIIIDNIVTKSEQSRLTTRLPITSKRRASPRPAFNPEEPRNRCSYGLESC
jgi:hypothetical protein